MFASWNFIDWGCTWLSLPTLKLKRENSVLRPWNSADLRSFHFGFQKSEDLLPAWHNSVKTLQNILQCWAWVVWPNIGRQHNWRNTAEEYLDGGRMANATAREFLHLPDSKNWMIPRIRQRCIVTELHGFNVLLISMSQYITRYHYISLYIIICHCISWYIMIYHDMIYHNMS